LPLNRPSETYAREWIELDSSTIAYWVGACTATLSSLVRRIQAHVLAAGRLPDDCRRPGGCLAMIPPCR